ncbi:hypothetical protein XA67_22050 [Comamonas thiooxydans]|uniref:hypothetical protein n=1 Tax=Comamonas thiooxydans TaxID=363952 RepID=UPI000620F460|nr:hypothetical protein [Comamonas thiooxydans]KKI11982.1 hypothetical protein XA67_22050 [Comamonas thiooxydans]
MKQVHNYDEHTGEYLGSSDAFESPLETGVYLIPAFATDIDLPECPPGKLLVFADGDWTLVDA